MKLAVTTTLDFVCPWCYLGDMRLRKALKTLGATVQIRRDWKPFELNPDMPPEGMDRKNYRERKFGWALSVQMDTELSALGHEEGIRFNFDAITRTPNTRLAHRLTLFAQQQGNPIADAYVQHVFQAYFEQGRDIGDKQVLLDIIQDLGVNRNEAANFLDAGAGEVEVIAAEAQAMHQGIHGVPHFQLGEEVISGAQRLEVFQVALVAATAASKQAYEAT